MPFYHFIIEILYDSETRIISDIKPETQIFKKGNGNCFGKIDRKSGQIEGIEPVSSILLN